MTIYFRQIAGLLGAVAALAAVSFSAMAQGNLQFNQIRLISASETVPTGKVWKVESVVYSIAATGSGVTLNSNNTVCTDDSYRSRAVVINGITTKVQRTGGDIGGVNWSSGVRDYISYTTMLPLWLPEGATLSGGPCNNTLSVIEFNVVP